MLGHALSWIAVFSLKDHAGGRSLFIDFSCSDHVTIALIQIMRLCYKVHARDDEKLLLCMARLIS